MKVQVKKKIAEAEDIVALELADPSGQPLPVFSAGAHIDVQLGGGLSRQYSLCNNPVDRSRYVLGVLLEPESRGGSKAVHALNEGDILEISEPRNHFPLDAGAKQSVLMAGGIGITPILCMAERLAHIGSAFKLHYCTRTPERTAFRARLEAEGMQPHARVYYDNAAEGERLNLKEAIGEPQADKHLYVCGPSGFIDVVLNTAKSLGWPESRLHREYFTGVTATTGEGDTFQVKVASSGQVIDIEPDQSITDALAANGIDIPVSCEQGVCGTCLTRVLEGEPDHRDLYLTDAERDANDQMLPCCSRSKSPLLVLDL
ncbi:MAG: 2Fe-2S iron-sulfur cluster-binding protein [Pigmentiphaga sp.]